MTKRLALASNLPNGCVLVVVLALLNRMDKRVYKLELQQEFIKES